MKSFKPMLAIDASKTLDNISYPKFASKKLDGIRCIFHPTLGMVSRSLKQIQNQQLQKKFEKLKKFSVDHNIIIDGELYDHGLTFQEISRAVMTYNFEDIRTVKNIAKELKVSDEDVKEYLKDLHRNLKFHIFDVDSGIDLYYKDKTPILKKIIELDNVVEVKNITVESALTVNEIFLDALDDGYEGIMLRDPCSKYKYGRSTLKQEWLLKVKPFETFDSKIIAVKQATKVNPNADKKINKLGRSVTSRKKDDRIEIEKAAAFVVKYKSHLLKVSIALPDKEKEKIWKNKDSYIDKMIEYKGLMIGSKNVPRHPVFVRFRDDRN